MKNNNYKQLPEYDNYKFYHDGTILNINKNTKVNTFLNKKNNIHCVSLYKDGKQKKFQLHNLLAKLFIPNTGSHKYVGFKDGDKNNCSVDNLFWIDPAVKKRERNKVNNDKRREKRIASGRKVRTVRKPYVKRARKLSDYVIRHVAGMKAWKEAHE